MSNGVSCVFKSLLSKPQNQYEAKSYAISKIGKVKWCKPEMVMSNTAIGYALVCTLLSRWHVAW